jgi:hypothetical protein
MIDIIKLIGKVFTGGITGKEVTVRESVDANAVLSGDINNSIYGAVVMSDGWPCVANNINLYLYQPGLVEDYKKAGYTVVGFWKEGKWAEDGDAPSLVAYCGYNDHRNQKYAVEAVEDEVLDAIQWLNHTEWL